MFNQNLSFSEALDGFTYYLYASGYSDTTVEAYISSLKRICDKWENPKLEDINRFRVQAYFADLKKSGRASETVRTYVKHFRAFFNWARNELEIQSLPDLSGMKNRQKTTSDVNPLSESEIIAMLKAAKYTRPAETHGRKSFTMPRPTAKRDIALIMTLLDTGLRVSECARLTMADVNLKNGEIRIKAHETGLKSKPRTVVLGKNARNAVWRYTAERDNPDQDDPLFVTMNNKPMDRNSIRKVLNSLGNAAGIKGVHPHRFRHTFAIQYLRNGGDPFTLRRLIGHEGFRMVNYYLSLSQDDVNSAHKRASPVDNWDL